MNSLAFSSVVLALAVLVTVATAWPYEDDYSTWRLARSSRRSQSQCTGSGGKCYSTEHCCVGFVCAAFDDYFGNAESAEGSNPEIPGYCVKEKHLAPCVNSRQCPQGATCQALGRDGESYCVGSTVSSIANALEQVASPSQAAPQLGVRGNGRLGSRCESTSDCRLTDNSGQQMCCQAVTMGRRGRRKICDHMAGTYSCL